MTPLEAHLAGGLTTVCRAWEIARRDGVTLGFTDHDLPLSFAGQTFRADAGMTAGALDQSTGLSVDNMEAVGVLSDPSVTEADIVAGRYDGAVVTSWLVNWANPDERKIRFRGTIGEIRTGNGAFEAELRGLAEVLNQPQGRAYHRQCSAVLGDAQCRFDLSADGYRSERPIETVEDARRFTFAGFATFEPGWFARGKVTVLSGVAAGLTGVIKTDVFDPEGRRVVELWQSLGLAPAPGDLIRIDAGCDKRSATCLFKFDNFLNFRGFPDIPGEDWLVSVPVSSGTNDGGSRR